MYYSNGGRFSPIAPESDEGDEFMFSPAVYPSLLSTTPTWAAGGFSAGTKFSVSESITIKGVKFWLKFPGGGTKNIRCKIYNDTVAIATKDQTALASGQIVEALFASPIIVAPGPNTPIQYIASVWDMANAHYPNVIGAGNIIDVLTDPGVYIWRKGMTYRGSWWAGGDARPSNAGGGEWYCVEPLI